jgi:ActR/RegA family two-component response regulator
MEEKKILLVDDEEVFLDQLKDALEHSSFDLLVHHVRNKGARSETT